MGTASGMALDLVLQPQISSRNDDDPNDSAAPRNWAALADCITDAGLPGKLAKAIIFTPSLQVGLGLQFS